MMMMMMMTCAIIVHCCAIHNYLNDLKGTDPLRSPCLGDLKGVWLVQNHLTSCLQGWRPEQMDRGRQWCNSLIQNHLLND